MRNTFLDLLVIWIQLEHNRYQDLHIKRHAMYYLDKKDILKMQLMVNNQGIVIYKLI